MNQPRLTVIDGEQVPTVLAEPARPTLGPVTVSCGAEVQTLTTLEPGVTAGEVADTLREILNIPEDAVITARGQTVTADYMLLPGDSLEFIRQAGRKASN